MELIGDYQFVLTCNFDGEGFAMLFNQEDACRMGFTEDQRQELKFLEIGDTWRDEVKPEYIVMRIAY